MWLSLDACRETDYTRLRKCVREKSHQPKRRVDVFKGTAELKSEEQELLWQMIRVEGITTGHKPVGR